VHELGWPYLQAPTCGPFVEIATPTPTLLRVHPHVNACLYLWPLLWLHPGPLMKFRCIRIGTERISWFGWSVLNCTTLLATACNCTNNDLTFPMRQRGTLTFQILSVNFLTNPIKLLIEKIIPSQLRATRAGVAPVSTATAHMRGTVLLMARMCRFTALPARFDGAHADAARSNARFRIRLPPVQRPGLHRISVFVGFFSPFQRPGTLNRDTTGFRAFPSFNRFLHEIVCFVDDVPGFSPFLVDPSPVPPF